MRRVVIESLSDFDAVKEVEKGPVILIVKRSLFNEIEHFLKKKMILFSIQSITQTHIVLRAVYPEHACHLHPNLLHKSYRLADPDVIAYLFKISALEKYMHIINPFRLVDILNEECKYGYKFFFIISRSVPSKGYIVCGGETGSILGVVYEDYRTMIGQKALKYILYRIPHDVFIYRIQTKGLRNT